MPVANRQPAPTLVGPITPYRLDKKLAMDTGLGMFVREYEIRNHRTGAPPTAGTATFCLAATALTATPNTLWSYEGGTTFTHPDVPRALSLTTAAFSSNSLAVTVTYLNTWGDADSETFTITSSTTTNLTRPAWRVIGVKYTLTGTITSRTLSVGTTNILGLPVRISSATESLDGTTRLRDVIGKYTVTAGVQPGIVDGVEETGTAAINAGNCTWLPTAGLPDDTRRFYITLRSTLGWDGGP